MQPRYKTAVAVATWVAAMVAELPCAVDKLRINCGIHVVIDQNANSAPD